MIKVVKYSEINFEKYEKCLENACQNSDFADKIFLDIVSDKKWFLLVHNDYEALMPVFYLTKFGLIFLTMPKFCRQLGVFSTLDDLFFEYLNKNFLVLNYSFNGGNRFSKTLEKKTSYFIKKNNYEEVKKNYSKNRRRNVRVTEELANEISIRNQLNEKVQSFFVKNIKGATSEKDSLEYYQILSDLVAENNGKFRVLEFSNEIQTLVYLFEGKQNFYLSAFINSNNLANSNFPSIIIDQSLKEWIEIKNFDFAGSDIENVAVFNERFGAKPYQYSIVADKKFTLIKKLLMNYRIISNFAV
jgi:hypothetical protein